MQSPPASGRVPVRHLPHILLHDLPVASKMPRMTTAAANAVPVDDREYIAALEIETRRLRAEAQRIEAEASRLGAQVWLARWNDMRRSDEFHARHPWVRYVVTSTAVLGGAVVGAIVATMLVR